MIGVADTGDFILAEYAAIDNNGTPSRERYTFTHRIATATSARNLVTHHSRGRWFVGRFQLIRQAPFRMNDVIEVPIWDNLER